MKDYNSQIYECIDFIKVPLTLMVIFIHTFYGGCFINGENIASADRTPFFILVNSIISKNICQIAVPIFFTISGYLFFKNTGLFTKEAYIKKLKSRFFTLLIPYLIWNCIYLAAYFIIQSLSPTLFSGNKKLVSDYAFIDFSNVFWSGGDGYAPLNYPLWYIRDLIIMCIASPIVYFLVKKLKVYYIISLVLIYILYPFTYRGVCITSILFFSLGAYLQLEKINFYPFLTKYVFLNIPIYVLCLLLIITQNHADYLHNISIIIGGGTFCSIIFYIKDKGYIKHCFNNIKTISKYTFFIYACHALPTSAIGKLSIKLINNYSDLLFTSIYIIIPVVVFSLCIYLYKLIYMIRPEIIKLLCGFR